MSTSPAKLAANQANAQHSTGPRTESGKSASSKNAIRTGLFSAADFIRPGEQSDYDDLDQALRDDLLPEGPLEHHLVNEIRRAMWRLRRCGEVEAAMLQTGAESATPIPDPMQNEPTARLQSAVDRARSQSHRLFSRCVAELRKLQTERQFRGEYFGSPAKVPPLGMCDWRASNKGFGEKAATNLLHGKVELLAAEACCHRSVMEKYGRMPAEQERLDPIPSKRTQTARNSSCPCGSGRKYKRCCGRNAAPVLADTLHAAA